jgi:hypothetical protein
LYRLVVFVDSFEHTERRDWPGFVAGVPVSLRARVAAARQKREAEGLPEVQEPKMGHSEGPKRPLGAQSFDSKAAIDPEGILRCMIHFW